MSASPSPADRQPLGDEPRTLLMPRREGSSELQPGHRLQEFVIRRVLGVGGYSIVYLAHDTRLDRKVALKEYLPSTLATRLSSGEVVPRLPRFEAFFDKGLQSFIQEARLLGAFDHPGLVKVYRFWAEAGTGYMVMPFYEGITLRQWLADLGAPPSETWLRLLAQPLMEALGALHAEGCYHRDVAPDNILMLYDRSSAKGFLEQRPRPVLLDFGAARRVIGDATQNLTAILKSGYSPVEQYEGETSMRQGAWTDVYALSAVLYAAVVGRVPTSSIARVVRDELAPARVAAQGRYTDAFLAAIDAGLAVRPEHRPQSLAAFQALLDAREAPPAATLPAPPGPVPGPGRATAAPAAGPAGAAAPVQPAWLWPALGVLALVVLLAAGWVLLR